VFGPDAKGGQLVMAPFADLFGVRAAEHFNHMLDAQAEAAFLADAMNARKELLRRHRPVPGLPRRQAIIAPAAIARGEAATASPK